jgi:serine/threonine protein kinase
MEGTVRPGDTLLGKYQVERVLGQGGMGVVVAVRHLELGELFAIKLLLPKVSERANAVSRFVREARAAARLKSEHVVRVHDVGRLEGGAPYMVMEHLVGDDLAVHLQRRRCLPLEEAGLLVLQACDAIAEAHALGIVHRDLKPSNLFLMRRRNGSTCLKVLDFGISKQTEDVGVAADQTESGAILGSLLYMSPEQMLSPKAVDRRSDIWAMGVVLYELTTGQRPFEGDSLANLLREVMNSEPPPPSKVRPELPAALDEVVLRCLRKRPEERYADAEELAAAVRALIGRNSQPSLPPMEPSPSMEPTAASVRQDLGHLSTVDAFGAATTLPPPSSPGRLRTSERAGAVAEISPLAEPLALATTTDATPVVLSPSEPGLASAGATTGPQSGARPSVRWRWAMLVVGAAGLLVIGLATASSLQQPAASGADTTPSALMATASQFASVGANPEAAALAAPSASPSSPPTVTQIPSTSITSPPTTTTTATTRPRGTNLATAKRSESKVEPAPSASVMVPAPPPTRKQDDADGVY